mmetsp:Transcript_30080/g.52837  ORF Transcript_30080/g.52837 Transcript_30080/m.52837 type:complete len:334 (+) Transcript_30080:3-1004(+)
MADHTFPFRVAAKRAKRVKRQIATSLSSRSKTAKGTRCVRSLLTVGLIPVVGGSDVGNGKPGRYVGSNGYDSLVSFGALVHSTKKPHTLICGTVPSINSFDRGQYYATHSNAFWHIVGDAFGHRRKEPDGGWRNKNGGKVRVPDFIHSNLLYQEPCLSYEEQVELLLSNGYALWDVLQTCDRMGATDSKIKNPVPSDIRGFCMKYPSISKICFASGASTASYFRKYNKQWLQQSNGFTFSSNSATQKVFKAYIQGKQCSKFNQTASRKRNTRDDDSIHLVVMYSVSPAYNRPWKNTPDNPQASRHMYTDKRAFWFREAFGIEPPKDEHRYYDE